DQSASALSRAIVRELNAQGSPARYLPADASPPSAGWLVNGVFYALDSRDPLLKLPFLDTAPKGPNTEVTVEIANLAVSPDVPFAVIGTDYRLKGQGSAVSWNPYIVAAKFVVNKIEASKSIDALANQIVAEIIAHRSSLAAHDPAAQHR
ncbi:hypothetical protein H8B02_46950, partial [Bradyrhizobium sp. Pear77]|uniref:hypothetical protein n=1 Tax=Bradyrhizobium altum TaxID=1571202 RepID=UPI001E2AA5ED